MNVRLIAFSKCGSRTACRAAQLLRGMGHSCACFAPERACVPGVTATGCSLREWTGESMKTADAVIFCCAAGIAVRGIAPFVKDKKTDPAVIVVDETAKFCIPILSGHIGGANELALQLAQGLGAVPVVTTATDLHGLFAVDVFARKNHLFITDMKKAKEISAKLLEGEPVGICSELPLPDVLPEGLVKERTPLGIRIAKSEENAPFERALTLIPQRYVIGMGCKKDKDVQETEAYFLSMLARYGITVREVRALASIDIKKNEACFLHLSEKYHLPFLTFTAQQMNALQGEFSGSDFVRKTVGVDCVCERAAVCAGAQLLHQKTSENGMTLAVGKYREEICFE